MPYGGEKANTSGVCEPILHRCAVGGIICIQPRAANKRLVSGSGTGDSTLGGCVVVDDRVRTSVGWLRGSAPHQVPVRPSLTQAPRRPASPTTRQTEHGIRGWKNGGKMIVFMSGHVMSGHVMSGHVMSGHVMSY